MLATAGPPPLPSMASLAVLQSERHSSLFRPGGRHHIAQVWDCHRHERCCAQPASQPVRAPQASCTLGAASSTYSTVCPPCSSIISTCVSAESHLFRAITACLLLQSPTCVAVMDTPQFQRLRDLHQLGPTSFVFPGEHLQCSLAQQKCYLTRPAHRHEPLCACLHQQSQALSRCQRSAVTAARQASEAANRHTPQRTLAWRTQAAHAPVDS